MSCTIRSTYSSLALSGPGSRDWKRIRARGAAVAYPALRQLSAREGRRQARALQRKHPQPSSRRYMCE
jgi:hypothetical protein